MLLSNRDRISEYYAQITVLYGNKNFVLASASNFEDNIEVYEANTSLLEFKLSLSSFSEWMYQTHVSNVNEIRSVNLVLSFFERQTDHLAYSSVHTLVISKDEHVASDKTHHLLELFNSTSLIIDFMEFSMDLQLMLHSRRCENEMDVLTPPLTPTIFVTLQSIDIDFEGDVYLVCHVNEGDESEEDEDKGELLGFGSVQDPMLFSSVTFPFSPLREGHEDDHIMVSVISREDHTILGVSLISIQSTTSKHSSPPQLVSHPIHPTDELEEDGDSTSGTIQTVVSYSLPPHLSHHSSPSSLSSSSLHITDFCNRDLRSVWEVAVEFVEEYGEDEFVSFFLSPPSLYALLHSLPQYVGQVISLWSSAIGSDQHHVLSSNSHLSSHQNDVGEDEILWLDETRDCPPSSSTPSFVRV